MGNCFWPLQWSTLKRHSTRLWIVIYHDNIWWQNESHRFQYFDNFISFYNCAGACSVGVKSMDYILSGKLGPGNAAVVVPGGALEALEARPGGLTVNIKKRKGFVKVALRHGYVSCSEMNFQRFTENCSNRHLWHHGKLGSCLYYKNNSLAAKRYEDKPLKHLKYSTLNSLNWLWCV